MSVSTYLPPAGIDRARNIAQGIGAVFLALTAIGYFTSPDAFFHAYLAAYFVWLGAGLGCLALLMVQFLSGGDWGLVSRRVLEAGARTIPLLAILFLPIVLLGMHRLYPWTDMNNLAAQGYSEAAIKMIQHKASYLNLPFFYVRAGIYFAIWLTLSYLLTRWSEQQDTSGKPSDLLKKMQALSGPGIVLYGITLTFAAIDWAMSLEPQWVSTIYGFMFIVGEGLCALSAVIIVMALLGKHEPLSAVLRPKHFHDIGKLLFAFTVLWFYMEFSQLVITWAGNQPHETSWYTRRLQGPYGKILIFLAIFQFVLPFFLLLSRDLKRDARRLIIVACLVFVVRFVDLFWMTSPDFAAAGSYYVKGIQFSLFNLTSPIGIGGLWIAMMLWGMKGRPLLPVNDPYMEAALVRAEEEAKHHA